MYCRKCGKEINDDAYVCIYCGAKAHEKTTKFRRGKPRIGRKKILKKFRANFVQTVDKQKKIWYYFYCF